MSTNKQFYQEGQVPRNELPLPPLYFVAMDDWVDKLGDDAFIAYLKMWTFCNRKDKDREYDKIPMSLEDTWNKLGMGKKKFYEKIVRPLWNYGLIDIVEWEDSPKLSQKPKNIIVYKYPQNRFELAKEPLQKVRDYDTDYNSESMIFGRKGGRPKSEEIDGFQTETVEKERFLNGNGSDDGFQTETVTVSKQKPININTKKLKDLKTSSSSERESIDLELREKHPDVFDEIKMQLLKDDADGKVDISNPERYKGLLSYRLDNPMFKKPSQPRKQFKHKATRTEMLPDWFEEDPRQPQQTQQPKSSLADIDAKKKEIEELLSEFRK